jgi:hypothetical protein
VTQPRFGITTSVQDAVNRANEFGVQFVDLHFRGDAASLRPALDACDSAGIQYVLNFEGAPVGWTPPPELVRNLDNRPGLLGLMLDEADHMQINAHWPVIDYYGYDDQHYLAETAGLDLFASRQAVLSALRRRNEACTVAGKPAAAETMGAVQRRVREGATCVLPPRLAPPASGLGDVREITLVGDGNHLVYDFGRYEVRFAQAGGDYPYHEFGGIRVPVTQAGADPDRLEVEIKQRNPDSQSDV